MHGNISPWSYFKFTCVTSTVYQSLVQLQNIFNIFRSIKETNWLINKGMCVLLFDAFKHLLLRKTAVPNRAGKEHFSERKFEEMH